MTLLLRTACAAAALAAAIPTVAAMPAPVRAMLDAAIASGKDEDVETVAKLAKATNPGDAAEIDAVLANYRAERAATKAAEDAAAKAKLGQAGFFENWKGEGQVGASLSTGNTDSHGLSLGLALKREGVNWSHRFLAQADYQKTEGVKTMERFLVELEPQYNINERLFAYGLGRWERDKFQGYDTRLSASGGLGYKVVDEKDRMLAIKGGPAWRKTDYVISGSESELTGLAGLDLALQLTPSIRLTQTASALIGGEGTTINTLTAVTANVSGALSARISYGVNIDTKPPVGIEKKDTLTRFTLVYGF